MKKSERGRQTERKIERECRRVYNKNNSAAANIFRMSTVLSLLTCARSPPVAQAAVLRCDWWVARRSLRVAWRCSTKPGGAPSAMTNGTTATQRWCADSLDSGTVLFCSKLCWSCYAKSLPNLFVMNATNQCLNVTLTLTSMTLIQI